MRVLAVTTNASLVVALGSMMREWEVVTVRDLERATAEAAGSLVALIDLGETDAGVQMADQLYHNGITIPCVVVGDKNVDDARATVLVRPFSLEELGNTVREAASRPARSAAPAGRPAPALPPEPASAESVSTPETIPLEGNGSAGVSAWQEPQIEPDPEPEPASRMGLTVAHEVDAPLVDEPLTEAEPSWEEQEPEPEPQPVLEEPVASATRPVFHEPVAEPVRTPSPERSSRWKLGRRGATTRPAPDVAAEAPLVRRLKVAAAHARELEELIEQLPFLADLGAMADGLIGEIDRQFVCAIASVSVLRDQGYEVVAHRGLSRVEAGMVIPENQSLFNDVLKTREGVLIQPVDLAQGLVAGIGGARTEALMVAPALVDDECAAVVVVGGDQFAEADLDRLSDLAAEAAPGLAVAHLLERLRARDAY
ncbi:MAG: hypothetical protein ACRDKG_11325 [Actinomycetota bacterium]